MTKTKTKIKTEKVKKKPKPVRKQKKQDIQKKNSTASKLVKKKVLKKTIVKDTHKQEPKPQPQRKQKRHTKTQYKKQKNKTYTIRHVRAIVGIIAGLAVIAIIAFSMDTKRQSQLQQKQIAAVLSGVTLDTGIGITSVQPAVPLHARAAIVYDVVANQILFEKDAQDPLPLASLTKLFTALIARDELVGAAHVRVSQAAIATEGESGLLVGDEWQAQALSDYMLAVSSNDAAAVFAQNAALGKDDFVSRINMVSHRLGLDSVTIFNETGLDIDETSAGAYGSAQDIARLLGHIATAQPELLEATTLPTFTVASESDMRYTAVNTNKITGQIPGLIGGKTGFTDLAGGNLAVVFDASIGRPIVVVVLGSTRDGRFDDVLALVNSVLK